MRSTSVFHKTALGNLPRLGWPLPIFQIEVFESQKSRSSLQKSDRGKKNAKIFRVSGNFDKNSFLHTILIPKIIDFFSIFYSKTYQSCRTHIGRVDCFQLKMTISVLTIWHVNNYLHGFWDEVGTFGTEHGK